MSSTHNEQMTMIHEEYPQAVIFHADMDAFYASIEQRDNPEYRGKPVIVGAKPGNRGVVSAASYEARKFGIHSALPIAHAYAKCPQGIFVRPRMSAYTSESHEIMEILREFTPVIEQISVDEAFMDMSGTEKLWGAPLETARMISDRIRQERELTVSIGIAPNKFLAKLASDVDKPNGITLTPFEQRAIEKWLAPMPVSRIWGVGAKGQEALASWNIYSIADLQTFDEETLSQRFGRYGSDLFRLCRGIDHRAVGHGEGAKSISREHTFGEDCGDREVWRKTLLSIAHDVARRSRKSGLKGTTVVLTYRTPDFQRRSRRRTLGEPTDTAKQIYDIACSILSELEQALGKLRLIGLGLTNFGLPTQTSLFSDKEFNQAWGTSESAMDTIADKFGSSVIKMGGEIDRNDHSKDETQTG